MHREVLHAETVSAQLPRSGQTDTVYAALSGRRNGASEGSKGYGPVVLRCVS